MGIPDYPVHLEDPQLQGFFDGLAAGELRLTRDPDSGEWLWYPPEVVPGKPDAHLLWQKISPSGHCYTFTTVHRCLLPGDHAAEVPYTVVLFESDDAPGCRVPGVLVEADGVEPACGMRLVFRPVHVADRVIAGFAPA